MVVNTKGLNTAQVSSRVAEDNAPLGSVVATILASWSDGSPFTGTLSFRAPYSNSQGDEGDQHERPEHDDQRKAIAPPTGSG